LYQASNDFFVVVNRAWIMKLRVVAGRPAAGLSVVVMAECELLRCLPGTCAAAGRLLSVRNAAETAADAR
jgi:hypothetical protein